MQTSAELLTAVTSKIVAFETEQKKLLDQAHAKSLQAARNLQEAQKLNDAASKQLDTLRKAKSADDLKGMSLAALVQLHATLSLASSMSSPLFSSSSSSSPSPSSSSSSSSSSS